MSTSTLGGHVNTLQSQPPVDGRRRRRLHSDEFKANAVASCQAAGISVAAVAMANGINANLLRRWMRERGCESPSRRALKSVEASTTDSAEFIPVTLASTAPAAIRLKLQRGTTRIELEWPIEAADACGAWLRQWLT